jgi:hypothetical protein
MPARPALHRPASGHRPGARSGPTGLARTLLTLALLLIMIPSGATAPARAQSSNEEQEPNNTETEIGELEGVFCLAGELPEVEDQDLILWTLDEEEAETPLRLTLTGILGAVTTVRIFEIGSEPAVEPVVAGLQLLSLTMTEVDAAPVSTEVMLQPGRYIPGISRTQTASGAEPLSTVYEIRAEPGERAPDRQEEEPNDDIASANAVEGVFALSGDASLDDPYLLRIDTTSPPVADFETEPNDQITVASTLDPTITMRGVLDRAADDYFRIPISGDPQLWLVTVEGDDEDSMNGAGGTDTIHGDSGDDTIRGGSGDDSLFGYAGNDDIYGSDGNDQLSGFGGDDELFGDEGNDTMSGVDDTDSCTGGQGDVDALQDCENVLDPDINI